MTTMEGSGPVRPATTPAAAASLRGLCGGAVHLPGDRGYDMARSPWNLQIQHHPAAVAYPASAEEVAEVLRAARRAGLRVVPQGTGHGAAPLDGHLGDAVLLRTAGLGELRDRRRAALRPGRSGRALGRPWPRRPGDTGWPACIRHHRMSASSGTRSAAASVGMSRRFGLQCQAISAVEVVLADGSIVRATADSQPELFWALRGSAMPLGVVTALEFDLIPLETVVAGLLAWDWTRVEEVMPVSASWAVAAPDAATTSFRLLKAPDMEHIPVPLRGRRLLVVDGAVLGSDAQAAEIVAPLRALRPEFDTMARVPAPSLVRLHLDPEGPAPAYAR